jgi:hypothetical protein
VKFDLFTRTDRGACSGTRMDDGLVITARAG